MMRKIVESPWTLPIFIAVVLAIAIFGRAAPVLFKAELLTQVMPSLLTGLIAVAAIMERAVAVLNDIWFGEKRELREEQVRQTSIQLQAERAQLQSAWQAHAMLTQEAVRTGNKVVMDQAFAAAGPAGSAGLEQKTFNLAQALQEATKELTIVKAQQDRARLIFSYAIALVVSAVGVTTLASMFEVGGLSNQQRAVFRAVDILLTAGVLSGGTTGINAIAELLGTYVNTQRKLALERK
jgi:hypothetical protein